MQPYITAVKGAIVSIAREVAERQADSKLRLAFVRYTDYDVKENRTTMLPFTEDVKAFETFVGSIVAGGGGDECEDVFGGLSVALNHLQWGAEYTTNVLIHIADAPCHGLEFHLREDGGKCGDTFAEKGDPAEIPLAGLMESAIRLRLNYSFGKINDRTDVMIKKFNEEIERQSDEARLIQTFHALDDAVKLSEEVVRITIDSISVTKSSTSVDPSLILHRHEMDKTVPKDWSKIPAFEARQIQFCLPDLESMVSMDDVFAEKRVSRYLRVAPKPFAAGGLRYAFHARSYPDATLDEAKATHVVVKRFKRTGARVGNFKDYCLQLATSAVAAALAIEYGKVLDASGSTTARKISYGVARVVAFEFDPTDHSPHPERATPGSTPSGAGASSRFGQHHTTIFNLEPFMTGKYHKYTDNVDGVENSDIAREFASFSHWTYHHTNRNLMVVDLQGTVTDAGIVFTDPAIHSVNIHRFGSTNWGRDGFKNFFKTHKCTELCAKLGIANFKP